MPAVLLSNLLLRDRHISSAEALKRLLPHFATASSYSNSTDNGDQNDRTFPTRHSPSSLAGISCTKSEITVLPERNNTEMAFRQPNCSKVMPNWHKISM